MVSTSCSNFKQKFRIRPKIVNAPAKRKHRTTINRGGNSTQAGFLALRRTVEERARRDHAAELERAPIDCPLGDNIHLV
jgi:hypothetical protein